MPELPEVETTRRGMEPLCDGALIESLVLNRKDLRFPFTTGMSKRVQGQQIKALTRRGKYILMHLSGGDVLIWHLGMSGQIKVHNVAQAEAYNIIKHDHVIVKLSRVGKPSGQIVFHDPRRFGFLLIFSENEMDGVPFLTKMGAEPLGNHFSGTYLYERLKGRAKPIKNALLDQQIVAGLGNIYVCEALFEVGIHPQKQAGRLTKAQCDALAVAIVDVLNRAIKAGGSTLKDYKQTDGALGYFQHQFKVYGREGELCPKCTNAPTKEPEKGCITRIVQSGRSTFYCKNTQKKR